jgi:hypothetical protein
MSGTINKSSNYFEDKINEKPVKTEKNTAVFNSRKVNLQKTDTNTHVANNQQKLKVNARNKAVDYDIKNVAGLNKNFKAKLETTLATKPKKTGMISPKRSQETIPNKQLQIKKQTNSKQQDVAIQPTDGQTKIPTAPPVPPVAKQKNNNSLKTNVNYQRKNNWDEIPVPEQETQGRGTKITTPKTKESQDIMDELSKVLAKQNKS